MSMTDPIADLLTRIRNATRARHETLTAPHSKVKEAVLGILQREGFISAYSTSDEKGKRAVSITLKYGPKGEIFPVGLRRVSKPGCRIYVRSGQIKSVLSGRGVAIISTSKGLMTDQEARRNHMGGEVLCEVW